MVDPAQDGGGCEAALVREGKADLRGVALGHAGGNLVDVHFAEERGEIAVGVDLDRFLPGDGTPGLVRYGEGEGHRRRGCQEGRSPGYPDGKVSIRLRRGGRPVEDRPPAGLPDADLGQGGAARLRADAPLHPDGFAFQDFFGADLERNDDRVVFPALCPSLAVSGT